MKLEEEKLEAQLQYAKYEHETELLRERKFLVFAIELNSLLFNTNSIPIATLQYFL